ncbi:MAG: hypothetical protein IJ608_06185 [Lachnospiraceae bacterium]|nr:hypothetical protein [Lachnospiraceae bacterium]
MVLGKLMKKLLKTTENLTENNRIFMRPEVISLTGFEDDNTAREMADVSVYVPSHKYGIVESIHNLILQEAVDLIMERDGVKL